MGGGLSWVWEEASRIHDRGEDIDGYYGNGEIVLEEIFRGCCGTVYFSLLHLSSHINTFIRFGGFRPCDIDYSNNLEIYSKRSWSTSFGPASRMFLCGGFRRRGPLFCNCRSIAKWLALVMSSSSVAVSWPAVHWSPTPHGFCVTVRPQSSFPNFHT